MFNTFSITFSPLKRHGVKVGPGPQDLGTPDPRTRDPPQSLKVGPGTPLKCKSGTLIMKILHCLIYHVLDKYIIWK